MQEEAEEAGVSIKEKANAKLPIPRPLPPPPLLGFHFGFRQKQCGEMMHSDESAFRIQMNEDKCGAFADC